MKVIHTIDAPTNFPLPFVITLGNFDGVHLGHQSLLLALKQYAHARKQSMALISFENHPSEVLSPLHKIPLICTLPHKIRLLEQFQIDLLILVPFTQEFSEQSPEEFLKKLHKQLPFSHLILGHDAKLGKNKSGDQQRVHDCLKTLSATVEYVHPFYIDEQMVSSTQIRTLIQKGELDQAARLLGRKYSIYGPILGKICEFPNGFNAAPSPLKPLKSLHVPPKFPYYLDTSNLCIPPPGTYEIEILFENRNYLATAHIGTSTVNAGSNPVLEINTIGEEVEICGNNAEILFIPNPENKDIFERVKALAI